MTSTFNALQAIIRSILERPHGHEWSLQGFGMMRTYFGPDKKWRLNLWNQRFAVPGMSLIHDHPWDFTSWVICGRFLNIRYVRDDVSGHPYNWMVIRTGEGGGPDGDGGRMRLRQCAPESLIVGQAYSQRAEEIHLSSPDIGTITINDRVRRPDGEHARVFWPAHRKWVDAAPRLATAQEVDFITQDALQVLDSDMRNMRAA